MTVFPEAVAVKVVTVGVPPASLKVALVLLVKVPEPVNVALPVLPESVTVPLLVKVPFTVSIPTLFADNVNVPLLVTVVLPEITTLLAEKESAALD